MTDAQIKRREAHGVAVGDVLSLVVVHPNRDEDRDPVAKIDGVTTFIRFQEKHTSDVCFGQTVRAKIADIEEGHILAVALDEGGAA